MQFVSWRGIEQDDWSMTRGTKSRLPLKVRTQWTGLGHDVADYLQQKIQVANTKVFNNYLVFK